MTGTDREAQLSAAFVALADTLASDLDPVDLLHRLVDESTRLAGATSGSIALVGQGGRLRFAASTTEEARIVETIQYRSGVGPSVESFHSGAPVVASDIAAATDRWPEFAAEAGSQGFRSVHVLPLRHDLQVIGTMSLFRDAFGQLDTADITVAQALADVATIGILQHRAIGSGAAVVDQLQNALDSRILIEQAKGIVAGSAAISLNEAFKALHSRARTQNRTLRSVAEDVISAAAPSHREGD